jgi:hypothetical protein
MAEPETHLSDSVSINPAILRLPGITRSYIDSLIRIAGKPLAIDTLPSAHQGFVRIEVDSTGHQGMSISIYCGWYHLDTVYVNPHPAFYIAFAAGTMYHPPSTATPRGVLAHEFGHRLQWVLSRDSMPVWADSPQELFADRVSLIVLALSGEAPKLTNDVELARYIVGKLGAQLRDP